LLSNLPGKKLSPLPDSLNDALATATKIIERALTDIEAEFTAQNATVESLTAGLVESKARATAAAEEACSKHRCGSR
jgi:hypothetical protein